MQFGMPVGEARVYFFSTKHNSVGERTPVHSLQTFDTLLLSRRLDIPNSLFFRISIEIDDVVNSIMFASAYRSA